MKIQLDTNNKTIKIEEAVNLNEFYKVIKKLLPNDDWKEYTLESVTKIEYWTNPIYIERYTGPTYPWYGNPIYCNSGTITTTNLKVTSLGITSNTLKLGNDSENGTLVETNGVYNIEV